MDELLDENSGIDVQMYRGRYFPAKKDGLYMTGTITVIMVFSIPIIAIVTSHFQKQTKMKRDMLKDEIELEKLKHENYLMETEKMRLELEKMNKNTSLEDTFHL